MCMGEGVQPRLFLMHLLLLQPGSVGCGKSRDLQLILQGEKQQLETGPELAAAIRVLSPG